MANSLRRNLKNGEKLVMRGGGIVSLEAGGFGDMSFTSGSAILVIPEGSTESLRASGHDIDADETVRRFSAVNGWDKE